QTIAELVSALGFLGLILTAIGLYGVVSYGVHRRTREIGIRMALGAERNSTLIMVLREATLMGGIGCAVGLPLALTATRFARSLLFGIGPFNIAVVIGALTTLALALLLASLVPARRATRIDPNLALRYE